jgi:hypothetical protein
MCVGSHSSLIFHPSLLPRPHFSENALLLV